ncbi:MAG: hypothetical protein EAZ43_13045 [Betaproteobacteria bacterium]|nr:MAG: hypothetical protein EAZ43_13045 [Betaproteobacteria bacterium]
MSRSFSVVNESIAKPVFGRASVAGLTLAIVAALALSGCANAPEIPLLPKFTAPVTQTVYVPVYVEVEKPVPAPAPPPPPPEPIKLPEDQEQSLALLIEFARNSSGGADELRKDYTAAQAAYNKERTAVNRLRVAWYSSLLGSAAGDDARLLGLLEPLLAKTSGFATSHPLRPIAEVLIAQVNERGRQVREQKKAVDDLQQKLDALKAIEKQLLDRERRRN